MSLAYIDMLEELLRSGLAGLSRNFVEAQTQFIVQQQKADGGFGGRRGGSDLYYTDFAMRGLSLLSPEHPAISRAANCPIAPRGIVECFNALNASRILQRRGLTVPIDSPEIAAHILEHQLPGGGFAQVPGGAQVSAYHTFLAALCFELLHLELPLADESADAIASLRCADGGYAELAGQGTGQTNPTAAAVAFLLMREAVAEEDVSPTAEFLSRMQAGDGGLKAHAAATEGDLLSTFTGLLTLWTLQQTDRIDLSRLSRFLRNMAAAPGGFRAGVTDREADVEYTYYGVGITSLLRLALPRA